MTSDDLLFTLNTYMAPELPWPNRDFRQLRGGSTPDPLTLVIHWAQPMNRANEEPIVEPLPKHLLEPV